jgi:hypothetical protein
VVSRRGRMDALATVAGECRLAVTYLLFEKRGTELAAGLLLLPSLWPVVSAEV